MSQPISIKLNELKSRVPVEIDGHVYTVRRMGNIEQIEYDRGLRRINQLAVIEKDRKLTEEELSELEQINSTLNDFFVNLFDDGGDQSKSKKLVASFSDVELGLVLGKIFKRDGQTS